MEKNCKLCGGKIDNPYRSQKYHKECYKVLNKERHRIYARNWLKKNKLKLKKLRQTKRWKDMNKVYKRNEKEKYPKKIKARALAQKVAVEGGKMCEICNERLAIEKHHQDYDKVFKVQFLCVKCHKIEHRKGMRFMKNHKGGGEN